MDGTTSNRDLGLRLWTAFREKFVQLTVHERLAAILVLLDNVLALVASTKFETIYALIASVAGQRAPSMRLDSH